MRLSRASIPHKPAQRPGLRAGTRARQLPPEMGKPERITFPTIEGSYRGMYPRERDALLKVYRQALAALAIPQGDIRRDFLSGMWLEAQGTYRAKGMAAADAEDRADYLIEEVMLIMAIGNALRRRLVQ